MAIILRPARNRGVTLIELLCVMLIIAILAALLLTASARAYHHAMKVLGH